MYDGSRSWVYPTILRIELGSVLRFSGYYDYDNIIQIAKSFMSTLAQTYKLHLLTIEDILNVSQRSKIEDFDNYIFITLKMLSWSHKLNKMYTEQLSLVIGENFVLSFSEIPFASFNVIRERLRTGHSINLLENGSDYLAYRLMDAKIDQYFVVLEKLSDKNEVMKVLTIISTIFITTTFITSLYGMNFKYMPELNWRYGYPAALIAIGLVSCGMLIFFRRKKWI